LDHDFVQDHTAEGQAYRTLNIIDEYRREALTIRVDRKFNSTDVLNTLRDLFILATQRVEFSPPPTHIIRHSAQKRLCKTVSLLQL
jgi:hypothetical protein